MQFVPESPRYLVYKGRSDKAVAILARAARINRATLPEGKLVTLEEKEHQLQLSKERQTVSPEIIGNRDEPMDGEAVMTLDSTMVTAVRYRKEIAGSCHGDDITDEGCSQDDSVGETIEMVTITTDSDKAILLPSHPGQKKVTYVC